MVLPKGLAFRTRGSDPALTQEKRPDDWPDRVAAVWGVIDANPGISDENALRVGDIAFQLGIREFEDNHRVR